MDLEAQEDARFRKQGQQCRDHLVQKGAAGCRVSDVPIKHRNVKPADAKRGNLVVLDVRSAGNLDECVLGPWEKQYMVGLVKARPRKKNNAPDDILDILMYEPYYYDKIARHTDMPMWAALKQGKISENECNSWKYLLGVPWLPVTQMPLSVQKALCEANGEQFQMQEKKLIEKNFAGSGIDVVKLQKKHGGYVDRQKASAIKFVMSLEEGEKPCPSSASAVILSEDTQDELLLSMFGPVNR